MNNNKLSPLEINEMYLKHKNLLRKFDAKLEAVNAVRSAHEIFAVFATSFEKQSESYKYAFTSLLTQRLKDKYASAIESFKAQKRYAQTVSLNQVNEDGEECELEISDGESEDSMLTRIEVKRDAVTQMKATLDALLNSKQSEAIEILLKIAGYTSAKQMRFDLRCNLINVEELATKLARSNQFKRAIGSWQPDTNQSKAAKKAA